jgi:alkylation response protein AidB-like acyl-CoA dehydrogenase
MSAAPEASLAASEDQQLIREAALQFLREQEPLARLRALRDGDEPSGVSPELWSEMGALGWPGLLAPEAHGGSGLGFQELGVVVEALGRHLALSPLFSSGVLATSALSLVGGWDGLAKPAELTSGAFRASVALDEGPHFNPDGIATWAEETGDGYRLHGRKRSVLDGFTADLWLVVARLGASDGDSVGLFAVPPSSQGAASTLLRWIDGRRAADLVFDGVTLPSNALLGEPCAPEALVEPLVDRAAATLACELVGVSAEAFQLTLDYLKTREQFGQPLASFQALQHRMARCFSHIELSLSLAQDAVRLLDEGSEEAPAAASAAKAHASETARHVTAEALQLHGGLGMTEEQDIGLFFKRARVTSSLWGDTPFHLARFARLNGF